MMTESELVSVFRIPIVAMTAHVMRGDRERCMEAGMDDYLAKPVEPGKLARVLEKWLPVRNDERGMMKGQGGRMREEKESSSSLITDHSLLNPDPGPAVFDRADLLRRLGDEELAASIMQEFIQTTPERLNSLAEAKRMQDSKAVHEIAHALKGSAATVGAKALAAVSQKIENAGEKGDLAWLESLLPQAEHELERLRAVVGR